MYSKNTAIVLALFGIASCTNERPVISEAKTISSLSKSKLIGRKKIDPRIAEGVIALKENRLDDASRMFNLVLQETPGNAPLQVLNGMVYERVAQEGDAMKLDLAAVGYQTALNIDPNQRHALIQLGRINYKKKNYLEAQEYFANALLLKPDDAIILHELAAASYYAQDLKVAYDAIRKAERLDPNNLLIKRSAGVIYAAAGLPQEADEKVSFLEKAVGHDPDLERVRGRVNDWGKVYKDPHLLKLTAAEGIPPLSGAPSLTSPSGAPSSIAQNPGQNSTPSAPSSTSQSPASPFASGGSTPPTGQNLSGPSGPASSSSSPPSQTPSMTLAPPSGMPSSVAPIGGGSGGSPYRQMIVVDCYILRILEEARTSKGKNILQSGVGTGGAAGPLQLSLQPQKSSFKIEKAGTGTDAVSVAGAATSKFDGTRKLTQVFERSISWPMIQYNLNIANAADQKTEVLARPTLIMNVGKKAMFHSGDEYKAGLPGTNGGSIGSIPTGIKIEMTPTALNGEVLSLDVNIEGSFLTTTPRTDTPLTTQTVNVSKAHVTTSAQIKVGETLMLAGTHERFDQMGKSGFPILQDIPGLQYLFSQEDTQSLRRSVLYLLTPRFAENVRNEVRAEHKRRFESEREGQPSLSEVEYKIHDWSKPAPPNIITINKALEDKLYREYRTGDIVPPFWGDAPAFNEQVDQIVAYLYY